MAAGADPTLCARALTAFTEAGKALLRLAEQESREAGSLQEFIRQKISISQKQSLLGLIEAAADLFRSLCVKRKEEAEGLWRRNSHLAAVAQTLQEFGKLQAEWDAFLQRLDEELQLSAQLLDRQHQSEPVPEIPLIDARTGEEVTLEKYLGKGKKILLVLIRQFSCLLCRLHLKDLRENQTRLDERSVEVVVVSFGCQEGASHWLQETGCQYHMLLDPGKKLYAAFGLEASLVKVLNFSNMLSYAEYLLDGLEFPRGLPSMQEDMFQLGGDFLLSEHGRVLFSHRSQSPVHRPSLQEVLSAH